jgi:hypothetical protein
MNSKNQTYYIKAEDGKLLPRITVNLEMPREEKIKKWTKEQKQGALAFLKKVEKDFNSFKEEIIEALK